MTRLAQVRIELGGFTAYYEEQGSGAPVVLIHGLGGSTAMWQRVIGPLAGDFRVLAYDLRGLGRSETPPPPYTLGQLVDDLHGLVEGLGLEQVALVGHSLGGAVALGYAAAHPDRVAALVGVSAPSITPPEQRSMLAERAALATREGMDAIASVHVQGGLPEAFREAHPEATAVYRSIIAGGDPVGYAGLCGVIADLDRTGELDRIVAPTRLVEGELDRIVPPEAVRRTAAAIGGCEYVELAGCGHIVPFERPDDLVAQIREFVGRAVRAVA